MTVSAHLKINGKFFGTSENKPIVFSFFLPPSPYSFQTLVHIVRLPPSLPFFLSLPFLFFPLPLFLPSLSFIVYTKSFRSLCFIFNFKETLLISLGQEWKLGSNFTTIQQCVGELRWKHPPAKHTYILTNMFEIQHTYTLTTLPNITRLLFNKLYIILTYFS